MRASRPGTDAKDAAGPADARIVDERMRGRWKSAVFAAVALIVLSTPVWLILRPRGASSGVPACSAVTPAMVERATGALLPAQASDRIVDGGESGDIPAGATSCDYGALPGVHVSVVAFRHNAGAFYSRIVKAISNAGVKTIPISASGYRGFVVPTPPHGQWQVQGFYLLKHGQFVNALIFQSPPGAARVLADEAGSSLP